MIRHDAVACRAQGSSWFVARHSQSVAQTAAAAVTQARQCPSANTYAGNSSAADSMANTTVFAGCAKCCVAAAGQSGMTQQQLLQCI